MDKWTELIRASVRPLVCLTFVVAQCVAYIVGSVDAAKGLAPFTGLTVGFYFNSREKTRQP